jgi:hypothetical protein
MLPLLGWFLEEFGVTCSPTGRSEAVVGLHELAGFGWVPTFATTAVCTRPAAVTLGVL